MGLIEENIGNKRSSFNSLVKAHKIVNWALAKRIAYADNIVVDRVVHLLRSIVNGRLTGGNDNSHKVHLS